MPSSAAQDEATVAEVAKAEKERLKQQQMQKKQLVEKMRAEQNALAEQGEVMAIPPMDVACCSAGFGFWQTTDDTVLTAGYQDTEPAAVPVAAGRNLPALRS